MTDRKRNISQDCIQEIAKQSHSQDENQRAKMFDEVQPNSTNINKKKANIDIKTKTDAKEDEFSLNLAQENDKTAHFSNEILLTETYSENPSKKFDQKAQNKKKRAKKKPKVNNSDVKNTDSLKTPINNSHEPLEHLPEAYEYLEYISVEYPSQTICANDQNILFAQSNKEKSSLISATFKNLNKNARFTYDKLPISFEINRIRRNDQVIVAISDHKGLVYNHNLELEIEINKSFSFGLDCNTERAFFGTQNGKIVNYDLLNDTKESIKIHQSGIDSLKTQGDLLYSASNDKTLAITDLRTKLPIRRIKNNCDVNAVDVHGNFFIYGDDNGIIHYFDMRNEKIHEQIKWHESPINSLCFSTENIFASVSDEQIALYDTTLIAEEGWTAHKWLWFVHKGQQSYKEACFLDDKWVTTSTDGIAIFKPTQEMIDSEIPSDLL